MNGPNAQRAGMWILTGPNSRKSRILRIGKASPPPATPRSSRGRCKDPFSNIAVQRCHTHLWFVRRALAVIVPLGKAPKGRQSFSRKFKSAKWQDAQHQYMAIAQRVVQRTALHAAAVAALVATDTRHRPTAPPTPIPRHPRQLCTRIRPRPRQHQSRPQEGRYGSRGHRRRLRQPTHIREHDWRDRRPRRAPGRRHEHVPLHAVRLPRCPSKRGSESWRRGGCQSS